MKAIKQMFAPLRKGTTRLLVCDPYGNLLAIEGKYYEKWSGAVVGYTLMYLADRKKK